MARHEEDREDLLAEATAMSERAELAVDGFDEHVFIGFRDQGAASIYFGAEPVYQFDSSDRLRRIHDDGHLLKAESGRLVSLIRRRSAGKVQLVRHELSDEETNGLLSEINRRLKTLLESLAGRRFRIVGQVPADADIVGRLRTWLAGLPAPLKIADSPRVR